MGEDGTSEPDMVALGTAPTIGAEAPACQLAKQSIHEALFPEVGTERVRVGRFELLRRLGHGGMGEVYVAYDEQLDRQVAVKLLRREHSADDHARERLLREAQVLARLSHPNVVQVYEAGVHDDQVYLAMELVDGVTLRGWLEQAPEDAEVRPWTEVVPVMIAAGQGLAAAHAAGLTHRDFKPDNVLVGNDGRVRVLDFGLARPGAGQEGDASTSGVSVDDPSAVSMQARMGSGSLSRASAGSGSRRDIVQLTEPGSVVGTLAYMSPEQLAATPLDARSDQYSFCVSLYEALYGERPFNGRTFAAYLVAVTQGKFQEPATRSRVPRWLRALVRRGLSVDPSNRFADMDALLRELSRPHGRVWKLGLVASGLVLGGVGLSWAFVPVEPRPCALDEAALAGTWDDGRREALRAVFATPRSSAEAGAFVERSLSEWSDTWLESLRSTCEATRIAGTQSEAMLDLRSSCLERQRRETNAIVELLTGSDRAGVDHVLELLEQLPDIGVCDDPRLAETSHPMPTDPVRREAILAAYEQLGRARALGATARIHEADALAEQLEATTAGLDHLPLHIEVRFLAAERSLWRRRIHEAVPLLRAVVRDAEIAGLDELSATLRTRLAIHVVGEWGRPELQATVLEEAETAVARLGRPDDRRTLELGLARAAWLEDGGDYDAALAGYRASIESARDHDDLHLAWKAWRWMAHLLVQLRRFEDAERAYADVHAAFEQALGSSASNDADIELHLGLLELARGKSDEAEAHFGSARRLYAPLVDPDFNNISLLELAEAKLAFLRGDLEGASQGFAHVADIGIDDLRRAEAWEGMGVIRFYQGDMPGSLDAYRRARPLRLATLGPEHPSLGVLESNIGESLAASGDHRGALEAYADALALLERVLSPDHADLAFPYKGRGQSRLVLGDPAGARADLERALRLHDANPGEPVEHADVERTLARVLLASGEEARALDLARAAHQRLVDLGHHAAAAEISAWIDEHLRARL